MCLCQYFRIFVFIFLNIKLHPAVLSTTSQKFCLVLRHQNIYIIIMPF